MMHEDVQGLCSCVEAMFPVAEPLQAEHGNKLTVQEIGVQSGQRYVPYIPCLVLHWVHG